jgi:pimeloyl-ACP methyl ester carboxylesterase
MKIFVAVWVFVGLLLTGVIATAQPAKPTIVLVHGAFADSSSWYGVITILERDGYSVIAAANPLRTVKGDADTCVPFSSASTRQSYWSGIPMAAW